jgi:hypothetical protein
MFKLFMVLNRDNIDLHVRHRYNYLYSRLARNQDNVSEWGDVSTVVSVS